MDNEMFTEDTLWIVREVEKLKKANAREKRRKGIMTAIRKRKEEYSRKGRKQWEESQRHPYDKRRDLLEEDYYE